MRFIFIAILLFIGCAKPTPRATIPVIDTSQLAPEAGTAINSAINKIKSSGGAQDWVTLGLYLQAHGLYKNAITCYEAAINLPNTPTKTKYWLALSLAKLGEYDKAIANCSDYKNYTPALWHQGYWFIDLGNAEAAELSFTRALEVNNKAVAAIVGLARTKLQQNNPSEAIVILEDLRNRGGNHPYLSYLLGTAYQRAGFVEKASSLLHNTGITPPKWEDPWFEEMQSYKKGLAALISVAIAKLDNDDPTGALTSLELLAKTNPRHPTILTNLAIVQLQLNQVDKAITSCSNAVRWNPDHAQAQLAMATIFFQSGKVDRAENHVLRAIELRPANSQAHSLAGKIALRTANVQDAAKHFEQAIAIGSNNPADREMLGMTYLDLQRYDKAAKQFEFVLRISPNATLSIGGLAVALAKSGKKNEAMSILQKGLLQFPNDLHLLRAAKSLEQQRRKK